MEHSIRKENPKINSDNTSQKDDIKKIFELTLQRNSIPYTFGDFLRQKDHFLVRLQEGNEETTNPREPIFQLDKNPDGTIRLQTGHYVGKFAWEGILFHIEPRFGGYVLDRMLNFANDIYLDDLTTTGKIEEKNSFEYILHYLFVQNLQKVFLLGLPKAYNTMHHHDTILVGNLDIQQTILYDTPFRGKFSSYSRHFLPVPEIADLLHDACKIVKEKFPNLFQKIRTPYNHLREWRSSQFLSPSRIRKAQQSKALLNPVFYPYRKTLRFAEYILKSHGIHSQSTSQEIHEGYLVNMSELFEIYIRKLLKLRFPDWKVESPKIPVYNDCFFQRKIIPDIVMTKDNTVCILDVKYKEMNFRGSNSQFAGDVDREDFFQIHTYISYFKNQNYHVPISGLIYPSENGTGEHQTEGQVKTNLMGTEIIRTENSREIFGIWTIHLPRT